MESARPKALTEELVSVKLKLATSRVKGTSLRWRVFSVTKSTGKFEDDVNIAFMTVSKEATNATKPKVAITGLELKDVLKQAST